MRDSFNRTINYMRISITDRCNLRCRYCMPNGNELFPMETILTYEEILAVCEQAVSLGVTRFKVTGGEPLARKDCVELISQLKALSGVEQVTLTTNGVLLKEHSMALAQSGIDGINISLDTLDKNLYQQITGKNELQSVVEGIQASLNHQIPTKINAVLQLENQTEWQQLIQLAKDKPIDVRFIELMPIGSAKNMSGISNVQILQDMKNEYPMMYRDCQIHGNGPAVYYKIPEFKGSIGFISAIHGKYCNLCNRIRMTSTGEIKSCLCYESGCSVRDAVRAKDLNAVREVLKTAILNKPLEHKFEDLNAVSEHYQMTKIGG